MKILIIKWLDTMKINFYFYKKLNRRKKDVINSILNLEHLLSNTTLKSNSGLFIKAKYEFKISSFKINQESKEIFEKLLTQERQI